MHGKTNIHDIRADAARRDCQQGRFFRERYGFTLQTEMSDVRIIDRRWR
jgi:hypothetical protein